MTSSPIRLVTPISNKPAIIAFKLAIVAHDAEFLRNSLRDQHAIERIPVVEWQRLQKDGIRRAEIQWHKAHFLRQHQWIKIDGELTQGSFKHQFCNGNGTHIDGIGKTFKLAPFLGGDFIGFGQLP